MRSDFYYEDFYYEALYKKKLTKLGFSDNSMIVYIFVSCYEYQKSS